MFSLLLALFVVAQQPAPSAPAPATGQPPPAAAAPVRRPTPAVSTLQIRVTDRSGAPAVGVTVSAEGPVRRDGVTDAAGAALFRTMSAGTYRVRADGQGFVTFEKEVVMRAVPVTTEMALSAAPPPPPPPVAAPVALPPAPAPVAVTGPAGEPRTLSIPDMAERSLSGRDPVRMFPIGCSGMSRTQLIVLRESSPAAASSETEEMLYLVAGEATLKMGPKEQPLSPGWFAIVPRGIERVVTRRGRNPAIFLSTVGGQPCPGGAASQP
jgi:mannose-6-phosphate isomerase-like protein (cupin superfamily)